MVSQMKSWSGIEMGLINGKVWGNTSALIQNSFVELHCINAKAGYHCSEHKHTHKWNAFYVISGELEICVRKNDYDHTDVTVLRAGDFTTVRPGEYHWFSCTVDCNALELYYPEGLTEDIQRKSVGGVNTKKESPCTAICKLGDDGKCVGCGRTADEIAVHGKKYYTLKGTVTNYDFQDEITAAVDKDRAE